jgi:hypothetical protein
MGAAMIAFLIKLLLVARSRLKSRANLEAENIVLRQQVIVLGRKARRGCGCGISIGWSSSGCIDAFPPF